MHLISIIIPTYNAEKTIQETINSVLNQTFQDWELIIIDDGSSDQTVEKIKKIQDSRIKVFSYPNAGVSISRNRGLEQASGKFIAFLDHDDLWTPDKLELQLEALQKDPNVALAYSWTDHCDESGKVIALGRHITIQGNIYQNLLVNNFLDTASNPLIRKSALDEVGNFDSTINSSGEWDLWLRLASRYPFVGISQTQIFHRISSRAMSASIESHKKECLEVIERTFNQAPQSIQHLKKASLANVYKYLLCKSLEGIPNPEKGKTALGLLWDYIRHETQLRSQFKFIVTMFVKSVIMSLLPPKYSQTLLTNRQKS